MSDIPAPTPGDAAEVRAGIEEVCRDLDDIRALLAGTPDASALDALLAAVRDGTHADRAAALDALDDALQRAGDAAGLYEDTAARHWGADRPATSGAIAQPGYSGPPVTPRPAAAVFLCPTGSCSRRWLPRPDEAPPSCALAGEPLRWERL